MNIIRVKIDVTKLRKEAFFTGKTGAKYADLTLLPNRDGVDQYGNHYMAVQDIGKEARERGEKGPIVGNAKELERTNKAPAERRAEPAPAASKKDDDVPF